MYSEERCSSPGNVTINVGPVNDAPLAGVPVSRVRHNCSSVLHHTAALNVQQNDGEYDVFELPHRDVDGDNLTFTLLNLPENILIFDSSGSRVPTGSFTVSHDLYSQHQGSLKFIRLDRTVREFSFDIEVTDHPHGLSSREVVVLECLDVDPPPVAGIVGGSMGTVALVAAVIFALYRHRMRAEHRRLQAELESFKDSVVGMRWVPNDWDTRTSDSAGVDWYYIAHQLGVDESKGKDAVANESADMLGIGTSGLSANEILVKVNMEINGHSGGASAQGPNDYTANEGWFGTPWTSPLGSPQPAVGLAIALGRRPRSYSVAG